MSNLKVKFQYLVIFLSDGILAFLDLTNHLNIGPKDPDGFAPTNHGIIGTTLKAILVGISAYFLIKFIHSLVKNKIATTIIVIILVPALYIGAGWLAFSLYYVF